MDYKSKYKKYKEKYKKIKGGKVINMIESRWEDREYKKGEDGKEIISGKLKSGKITKDFKDEEKLSEISGKWEYKLEDNHYVGKFTSDKGEKREIDIIGKWEDSVIFYGLTGDKKKNNAKELKDMYAMEDNVEYKLKDFIKEKGYKEDPFITYDNWGIRKVNGRFTDTEINEYIKKYKKADGNGIIDCYLITDEIIKKFIVSDFLHICLYNIGLGINYNKESIKEKMLSDDNYFNNGGDYEVIQDALNDKLIIYNIVFSKDMSTKITLHPIYNYKLYNEDKLLKRKSMLLYNDEYIINNNNDIEKYKLIKKYFVPF